MNERDPLWYKDAVFYQLHVKAFFDSNDDGIGDFKGLTAKLDYLRDLGVTALWLLPFYPSPLRDDGYDIGDYRGINPAYGTMADFRQFVREAHKRDLRVVTELVVNHTSDQHPWFQRARQARLGSSYRNYYVWSDTDQKYLDTRIIFIDTEKSNWQWDPVAQQYYWHRFYSHQPDLNYDNPAVFREVVNVMRYWLDMGVDGLRLDAVPYLCEREGTNNENLPESHDILRRLRAEIDGAYENRMLLAEANQWPEDVRPYFGAGDECHMAFHFPLMPRIYMAVAQEDRHPITDIMRQTPDIPENCQWAVFLRNHDELTLEMVTDRERDYLWNFYASDPRMRLNLGIRRRLAALMENDRPRIDLLNSLLFSMPGTPVLYYGDEIGMGDNVYLGDRDGVRTPMQWSYDRNAGFSRADPARLFLPPIMDALYGFQAVNVEAQSRSGSSLLNYMRRLIAVRRNYKAFGRGSLTFLYPRNRKVLAYIRSYQDEVILCVVNLSRTAQSVELDLALYRGRVPVEVIGHTHFPPVADRPYHLTLQSYSFFWFALTDPSQIDGGILAPESEPMPEFMTLVVPKGWGDLLNGHGSQELTRDVLPAFLPTQRWFGAKDRRLVSMRIAGAAELPAPPDQPTSPDGWCLLIVEASFADTAVQRYLLPLGIAWGHPNTELRTSLLPQTLAQIRRFRAEGALFDAMGQEALTLAFVAAISERRELAFQGGGTVRFKPTSAFEGHMLPERPSVQRLGTEQSNSSVLITDYGVLKLYRQVQVGLHPEVEMSRYLTERTEFTATPRLLGMIELIDEAGEPAALGILTAFVRNQGDAWSYVQDYLKRSFDDVRPFSAEPLPADAVAPDPHVFFLTLANQLGRRTAELHEALCPDQEKDPAFVPEPISDEDLAAWQTGIRVECEAVFTALEDKLVADPPLDPSTGEAVRRLLELRAVVLGRIGAISGAPRGAFKTRYHGDYHLGQVLFVQNDFTIIDFEGEPRRTLRERRLKHTPLKDVASMIRSFDYAAAVAVKAASDLPPSERPVLERFCLQWRDRSTAAFLDGYRQRIAGTSSYPADEQAAQDLLALLLLEKVFYEIGYELANRPHWLSIPVQGAIDLFVPREGVGPDAID
jgi:maltose alpha-D-glucosyltransferase/alpha-amylase